MRHTTRTFDELRALLDVSAGRRPAETYLEGATLLNVYSGELYPANVAIAGGRIAYVGMHRGMVGPATQVFAYPGKILAPGYIDPHTHITGMATPVEFAREVLRTGTTAVLADAMQLVLQVSPDRVAPLLETLAAMPVRVLWAIRLHGASHLPDEEMFSLDRVRALLRLDAVRTAGEVTRWPAVYQGDEDLLRKIAEALAAGRRIDGHAPGVSPDRLAALTAAGWSSDHEAITAADITSRVRAGLYTMLRHSSLRPDVPVLAEAVTPQRARSGRLMLTADGPEAATIVREGYLDHVIRQAIAAGIEPVLAYQMATLAPAAYVGLDEDLGGIAPGRRADIVVLDDLREPRPSTVFADGRIAAQDGVCTAVFPEIAWGDMIPARFTPSWNPAPALFEMPGPAAGGPAASVAFPAMVLENSVITRRRDIVIPVRDGRLDPPPDVMRLVLLDPRGRWIVRGVLGNFARRLGGLASTFNVSAHLIVLGQDTADMARAARRVLELGGGIVAVEDGRTALEVPLPIGGIMAADRFPAIAERAAALYAYLRARGYPHTDPHYTLLFLPLDSLPDLRVTYRGVWDVRRNRVLVPRQDL
ncbi:MAG TPA: adenine deaminase C-terminal domain-containing protein [bacterium]|nr:adenine deaminase C-terminal domain-containing protein [bacterium]